MRPKVCLLYHLMLLVPSYRHLIQVYSNDTFECIFFFLPFFRTQCLCQCISLFSRLCWCQSHSLSAPSLVLVEWEVSEAGITCSVGWVVWEVWEAWAVDLGGPSGSWTIHSKQVGIMTYTLQNMKRTKCSIH